MKNKSLISIITLSAFFLVGCNGTTDTSSASDTATDYPFCEDDSSFFVFENDTTLSEAIEELDLGVQTNENRDAILDILGENDGYANTVDYTLNEVVDYDALDTLDDPRDFTGVYGKSVTRHDAEKILIGEYTLNENFYDEEASLEVTNNLVADYQVFRNGFCPAISRYYKIYDFPSTENDIAIEKVYGTEDYIRELYLVNGQALALDLENKYADYEDSELFSTLTFTANKFVSNAEGVVESNAALNTSVSLELRLTGSYVPSGVTLGERVVHSVLIVDGMIKKVGNFQGTYEVVSEVDVYRTYSELIAEYNVETVAAFSGTLLDPEDFTFSNQTPNL